MRLFIVKWSTADKEESQTVIVWAKDKTDAHTLAVEHLQKEYEDGGFDFDHYDDLDITDATGKDGVIHMSCEFIV